MLVVFLFFWVHDWAPGCSLVRRLSLLVFDALALCVAADSFLRGEVVVEGTHSLRAK